MNGFKNQAPARASAPPSLERRIDLLDGALAALRSYRDDRLAKGAGFGSPSQRLVQELVPIIDTLERVRHRTLAKAMVTGEVTADSSVLAKLSSVEREVIGFAAADVQVRLGRAAVARGLARAGVVPRGNDPAKRS
jgi:hypothetical protein